MSGHPEGEDVPGMFKWVVLIAAFLTQLCVSGITYCVGIYYVIFKEHIGGSSTIISLVSSLNTAFFFGIGPLAGVIIEKRGARPVAMMGAIVGTLGMASNVFVTQPWQLLLTFGIFTGGGMGLCYIPSITIVGAYFIRRRSIAMGIAVTGLGAGPIIMPPIITYFNQIYGWRGSILIISGILLHTLLFAALFRPVEKDKSLIYETKDPETKDLAKKFQCNLNLHVFKNMGFLAFFVQNILFSLGLSVINVHIGAFAVSLGYSEKQAAMLFFTMGVASAASRIFYGFLCQIQCIGATRVYLVTCMLCGIATVGYPFGWSYLILAVCTGLIGTFYGSYGSCPPLITVDLFGVELLPSAYGYVCVGDAIGFLLGGPAAGWLYDSSQNYPATFYLGGGFMIAASLSLIPVYYAIYVSKNTHQPVPVCVDVAV